MRKAFSNAMRPVFVCILLFLAVATFGPVPASACSLAGPPVGFAVIHDLQTQQEWSVTFDQVGIDAACGITNSIDVSESGILLRLPEVVRFFDLNGAILKDIRLEAAYYPPPRLDGNLVYYLGDDYSLRRMNVNNETVIPVAVSPPAAFEVSNGIIAWLGLSPSGYRLSVFDSDRQAYLVEDGGIPAELGNQTESTLELIALHENNVTFVKDSQEIYVHDFRLNTTKLLLRPGDYIGTVAHENSWVVYSSGGRLYLFDATKNETTVLKEDFVGDNLRMHANSIVFDFYRVYPRTFGFLIGFGVAASVAIVIGAVLLLWKKAQ